MQPPVLQVCGDRLAGALEGMLSLVAGLRCELRELYRVMLLHIDCPCEADSMSAFGLRQFAGVIVGVAFCSPLLL